MKSPGCRQLRGEAFDKVLVRKDGYPMCVPVGVVLKLPQMDDLVNRPGVGFEVADEVLTVASPPQCLEAELLVEFHRGPSGSPSGLLGF